MKTQLLEKLTPYHQEHLLTFWDNLTADQQATLTRQINELDLENLNQLIPEYVLNKPNTEIPNDLTPPPYFSADPKTAEEEVQYAKAIEHGKELLAQGKVSFLTVAGGQGTRLGFDGPKGTFPISPIQNKTFFQYFAEKIARLTQKYNHPFTWYIMTSELNDEATRNFFTQHNFFGLNPNQVVFFAQGTMPAISYEGKFLLDTQGSLALAPDGHGGTLLALRRKGCLDRMIQEGVEYISYFQIDNPLVGFADPLFIGLHADTEAEISARMLAKTNPYEKLGNFCVSNGRLTIIEYSDMPNDLAEATNADGSLKFICGSPAIHIISRECIERLTAGGRLNLGWHRADKKVGYIDLTTGEKVKPENNNAVKLESFIFDAIPLAKKTMILEGKREDEFAPTKNPTGIDSVESCREMMSDRDARWLQAAGVEIPDGAIIEISPLVAVDAEDVKAFVASEKFIPPTPNSKTYYA